MTVSEENGPSRPLERHGAIISLLSLRPSLQPWVLDGYLDLNCDRGMNQKRAFGVRWSGWGSVLPTDSVGSSFAAGT